MKNKNLMSKLKDLKKSKSLENLEGSMLKSIKGGTQADPCGVNFSCGTKCGTNCGSNML